MSRLDEQQRRWLAAFESQKLGYGGDTTARPHYRPARRYHPPRSGGTRRRPRWPAHRPRAPARRRSAARKKKDPTVLEDLKQLAEPATGGDPMTEDKFVRRSLRTLSAELETLGHEACPTTVAELLRDLGYNLRVNVKRLTGPTHPDRDRQFRYLEGIIAEFRAAGLPILSVDTKKKELVGNFGNPGAGVGRGALRGQRPRLLERRAVPGGAVWFVRRAGQPGACRGGDVGGHARVRGRCGGALVGALRLQALPGCRGTVDPGGQRRQ